MIGVYAGRCDHIGQAVEGGLDFGFPGYEIVYNIGRPVAITVPTENIFLCGRCFALKKDVVLNVGISSDSVATVDDAGSVIIGLLGEICSFVGEIVFTVRVVRQRLNGCEVRAVLAALKVDFVEWKCVATGVHLDGDMVVIND